MARTNIRIVGPKGPVIQAVEARVDLVESPNFALKVKDLLRVLVPNDAVNIAVSVSLQTDTGNLLTVTISCDPQVEIVS